MNTSSRRSLLRLAATGAAVLAITPARDLVAQVRRDDRSYESAFTGSVVELLDPDWKFSTEFSGIDETGEYIRESVNARSESARTTIEIEFLRSSVSPERYIEILLERHAENWDVVEIAGSGTGPDGPWFAASLLWVPTDGLTSVMPASVYCEYQAGAYEEEDLVVTVNTRPEGFEERLNLAQTQVLIGDLPPLTMLESSEVFALSFPVLTDETATTSTRGRSSRSTRGSGEEEETASSRRGENRTNTATGTDYPDAVLAHRTEFIKSFDDFAGALSTFIDETSTQDQQNAAFGTIDVIATAWLDYPDQANSLSAPSEYARLEDLYITWADEIAVLGARYFSGISGTGTVEQMIEQIDVVDQADRALMAEMGS